MAKHIVTPWEVKGDIDYNKLIQEFGTQALTDGLLKKLEKETGELHYMLRRKIFFSHRDCLSDIEFAELFAVDALNREESCGAHFREEHQTGEGEAVRNDEQFAYVAAWEYKGVGSKPEPHKEELEFENVELATRSYK